MSGGVKAGPETAAIDLVPLVEEGRQALRDIDRGQWKLGDIALKIAPRSEKHVKNKSKAVIRDWAEAVGIPFNTAMNYRSVAAAWPDTRRRASASWSVHEALIALPGRLTVINQDGLTVAEARNLVAEHRAEAENKAAAETKDAANDKQVQAPGPASPEMLDDLAIGVAAVKGHVEDPVWEDFEDESDPSSESRLKVVIAFSEATRLARKIVPDLTEQEDMALDQAGELIYAAFRPGPVRTRQVEAM